MAWQTQVVGATNSTSVLDKVTMGCFLEDHEIEPVPSTKQHQMCFFPTSDQLHNHCL